MFFPFEFHKESGQTCMWISSKHGFYMFILCHVNTTLFLFFSSFAKQSKTVISILSAMEWSVFLIHDILWKQRYAVLIGTYYMGKSYTFAVSQLQRCKLIYLKLNLIPMICALQLRKFLINYGPHCSVIEQGIEFRYDQYQINSITTCPPPASYLERKKMLSSEEETVHVLVLGQNISAAFHSGLSTQHLQRALYKCLSACVTSQHFIINLIKEIWLNNSFRQFVPSFFKTLRFENPQRPSKEQAFV